MLGRCFWNAFFIKTPFRFSFNGQAIPLDTQNLTDYNRKRQADSNRKNGNLWKSQKQMENQEVTILTAMSWSGLISRRRRMRDLRNVCWMPSLQSSSRKYWINLLSHRCHGWRTPCDSSILGSWTVYWSKRCCLNSKHSTHHSCITHTCLINHRGRC